MRDFRDAKAMAQTLRESLTTKAISISHSESLELVSRMLGAADWNTLSALLQADQRGIPAEKRRTGTTSYPAIPLRDLVPFPTGSYPIFVGREKTMHALNNAFESQREVVLAIQRVAGVNEPRFEDVYEVGVLAQLLEAERLPDGTLKVLAQILRRVAIRRFVGATGAFQADVAEISEGPIPDATDLIKNVVKRFESYAAARELRIPQVWPPLDQTRDPGRVADIIATRLALPIGQMSNLLATLDPVIRLKRIEAVIDLSGRPFSTSLSATTHRALDYANQRNHRYATLEHLLLALIDDADASALMRACQADLDMLRSDLLSYLDNELKEIVNETSGSAVRTAAFERVTQRATLQAQELGHAAVSGANALLAMFPETRSPAAGFLGKQGVFRAAAAELVARGKGEGT
ncbi:MAG: LON peptidase substrate-binding domain-containing protein [Pseudomonadota bacterium]